MMAHLTRPAMARGGRTGFKSGERVDLALENLTRAENAKRLGVKTRDAPFFKALPGYDNITYTDFKNKETGEWVCKSTITDYDKEWINIEIEQFYERQADKYY